jgi:hypothetical protein
VITPATLDITVQQNATFTLSLQLKDSTGAALNMTGYTVAAQIWTANRSNKLADLAVSWDAQALGKLTLTLAASATTKLGSDGRWDLLVTNPDGTKDYWLRGAVSTQIGYTQ